MICDDVNECLTNISNCDMNAVCNNNIGSYGCSCLSGYQGNGFVCEGEDINRSLSFSTLIVLFIN